MPWFQHNAVREEGHQGLAPNEPHVETFLLRSTTRHQLQLLKMQGVILQEMDRTPTFEGGPKLPRMVRAIYPEHALKSLGKPPHDDFFNLHGLSGLRPPQFHTEAAPTSKGGCAIC